MKISRLKSKKIIFQLNLKSFALELQRQPPIFLRIFIFLAHAFYLLDIQFVGKKRNKWNEKREKENTLIRKKRNLCMNFYKIKMLSLQDEKTVAEEDVNYLKKNSRSPNFSFCINRRNSFIMLSLLVKTPLTQNRGFWRQNLGFSDVFKCYRKKQWHEMGEPSPSSNHLFKINNRNTTTGCEKLFLYSRAKKRHSLK